MLLTTATGTPAARSAASVGAVSAYGSQPSGIEQPLVQGVGEALDAGVDGRGQPGVGGPVGVRVEVPVGPQLGQVRRHPGRQRAAGPPGGDQPVGQRRWPGPGPASTPHAAAAASTHSTGSSTWASVPWKSNSTASTGRRDGPSGRRRRHCRRTGGAVRHGPARRAPYRPRVRRAAAGRPRRVPRRRHALTLGHDQPRRAVRSGPPAGRRRPHEFPALAEFAAELGFDLDEFQREACEALERGSGVLVCAPTGAGKTVVGEFAVHLALRARAASASTPRRSRRCPTRSTTTWSSGTAPARSACSPATTRSTATRRWW